METTYLRSFALVLESGSMSEAARRLDLTPAAIAQQMRVLEREMGTELLTRAGRTVAPTAAGHRLLERSRALLRDVDGLKASVNEALASGELNIGTINTALHSLLPDVLACFVERNPQVRVRVRSALSTDLYDAVNRDQIDAAICLHPNFTLPKTLCWELLREEPLTVLAPARWARQGAHKLLASKPFIRYDRELGGGKQADRYLRQAGIVPTERFELNSLAAIAMLVDRELGVSVVPDTASLWPGLRVVKLPLPETTGNRRFGILWQRSSARGPLVESLAACARTVVARST
jgi:DNA-binding transcriptional LysR family regulator